MCELHDPLNCAPGGKTLFFQSGVERNSRIFHEMEENGNTTATHFSLKPIGYIRTCFPMKNGTPRYAQLLLDCEFTFFSQAILAKHTKGFLKLTGVGNNARYFLDGLEEFSHVHLLWIFHENDNKTVHAKISPPRLDGKKGSDISDAFYE